MLNRFLFGNMQKANACQRASLSVRRGLRLSRRSIRKVWQSKAHAKIPGMACALVQEWHAQPDATQTHVQGAGHGGSTGQEGRACDATGLSVDSLRITLKHGISSRTGHNPRPKTGLSLLRIGPHMACTGESGGDIWHIRPQALDSIDKPHMSGYWKRQLGKHMR